MSHTDTEIIGMTTGRSLKLSLGEPATVMPECPTASVGTAEAGVEPRLFSCRLTLTPFLSQWSTVQTIKRWFNPTLQFE